MKNKITRFGCTLVVCLAMTACNDVIIAPVPEPNNPFDESRNDSIQIGEDYIFPLMVSMTHLPVEDFEVDGKKYYCFLLKVEKIYPIDLAYLTIGPPLTSLSYSVNFKLFTEQKEGPFNGTWKVEQLDDVVSYYNVLHQHIAADKKTVAYLYGDRTFDVKMNASKYLDYQKSQVRIKSGTLHIKKATKSYLIAFEGVTETGEKVNIHFNDKMTIKEENQQPFKDVEFTMEMPKNYIQKGDKYYKLDDAYYYNLAPSTYQGNPFQTVEVYNIKDYYMYVDNDGLFKQQWKSNAVFLQFQFTDLNQFQAKTYQFAPLTANQFKDYIYGYNRDVPIEGFPNDSLVIGYYHIATIPPTTLSYDEDTLYMNKQIALKSGQLEVTVNATNYVFSGNLIDGNGEEVKVKFKAVPNPW